MGGRERDHMWDARFEEILRGHLPFLEPGERIVEDLVLRDYGLDSLAVVNLLVVLEDTYDVRIPGEALTLESFATPGRLWKVLSDSMAGAG
jgi:acyl carrier protein